MLRTSHITIVEGLTVSSLAGQTEAAIEEVAVIASRTGFQTAVPNDPHGGEAYYDEEADKLYVYNSIQGTWIEK